MLNRRGKTDDVVIIVAPSIMLTFRIRLCFANELDLIRLVDRSFFQIQIYTSLIKETINDKSFSNKSGYIGKHNIRADAIVATGKLIQSADDIFR